MRAKYDETNESEAGSWDGGEMMPPRKWIYWHYVVWVNQDPEQKSNCKVGTKTGLPWRHRSIGLISRWEKTKGFHVRERVVFLCKLPVDAHKIDPEGTAKLLEEACEKNRKKIENAIEACRLNPEAAANVDIDVVR